MVVVLRKIDGVHTVAKGACTEVFTGGFFGRASGFFGLSNSAHRSLNK